MHPINKQSNCMLVGEEKERERQNFPKKIIARGFCVCVCPGLCNCYLSSSTTGLERKPTGK